MSNIVSESLNELDCHSFKMGDNVIKKYGNKEVKFTFVFNKKGKKLKDILEQYKDKNIHIQYFKQNPVGKLYERLGFIANGETKTHYQMVKCAEKKIIK